MKNKSITIPANVFTGEEIRQICSIGGNGPISLEDIKAVNSVLEMRMETLQTQFREVDEDYKRVTKKFADGHAGDFDYLCSVSSRRAELHKQIESLKKAILKNKEVIDHEERQS
jgi:hypothetical protein